MPIRKRYQFKDEQGVSVEGVRVGRLNLGINTTFIIYRLGDTLIDAGPSNQWSEVRSFIQHQPVHRLLLSHHHEDHSGNAARIAQSCELTPYAPQQAKYKFDDGYRTPVLQKVIWGDPKPVKTQPMPDSQQLEGYGEVVAIHTPGHAKDLHCFYLPERKWLFSGDLYISKSLRMLRKDENLAQIMHSMNKVLQLDFDVLFCPHRGILEDGKHAMTEKLNNMLELCEQAQALKQKGLSNKAIVKKLLGPEEAVGYLTGFNFSKINLINQAVEVDLLAINPATAHM